MDEAVLTGIVLVAFGAPDLDVRWRAIDVLLAWPHLEWPWDSRAIARRAIENTPEYVPGCVEMGTVRVRKPIPQKRFTMILQKFFQEIGGVKS
ncbi:hypothetical protein BDV36DRAFT_261573 [Aspergillus pseudocaelatus]|uniref:Uncharacterized protein n=1 Tax=Aspergillus pseudocaelatus TaxID=1825620 RepID=A0ABQ6WFP5_9EURO|nr:hypothetical protein BDV36DRAFT_261573 [Aspergillus pseudocaelatus]